MVGGAQGQGKRALDLEGKYPSAKPFKSYKNGKPLNFGYNPNQ